MTRCRAQETQAVKPRKSVLIVSERKNFRHSLGRLLLLDGHMVQGTKGPLYALDVVRHRQLDLVATDIVLSNIDGIELIANARDLQENVQIVAFSDGCGQRERRALQKMDVCRCIRDLVSVEQAGEEIEAAILGREMVRPNTRRPL